jgi:surface antigen/LysM repeat protein
LRKEDAIRSLIKVDSATPIATQANNLITHSKKARFYKRLFRKHKKRVVRYGLLALNVLVLVAVAAFIIKQPNNSQAVQSSSVSALGDKSTVDNPLDQLSSADIAVNVARMTNMVEAKAVTNNADTVNTQLSLPAADDTVIAKPQIVNTAAKTNKDIIHYTVRQGDTINGLADVYGVPSDTIRWSNNLTGNNLTPGKEILIPPAGSNAIVYTIKNGDTADALALRFRADKNLIIQTNDAELTGFKPGELILIPNGVVVPVSAAVPSFFTATYVGNGYDFGYCTWWAALRRQQIGHPVPSNLGNASTWKVRAQLAGIPVGNVPKPGAVIWSPPRDYYGHVGFVESVGPDGSANISEMNVLGWDKVSYKTLTAAEASAYSYIYW